MKQRRASMVECILFIGLGNPGPEYENNRHNIGFKVIEAIANANASSGFKKMLSTEFSVYSFGNKKIILAKPQTFMNLSGRSVRFLVDFYKISISNVYVFHDDIDLEFAKVKVKNGGGNGGHNGLKSIDALIGKDYWRIRIGVGRPQEKSMVSSYVLHDFDQIQSDIVKNLCLEIARNVSTLLEDSKKFESDINQKLSKNDSN